MIAMISCREEVCQLMIGERRFPRGVGGYGLLRPYKTAHDNDDEQQRMKAISYATVIVLIRNEWKMEYIRGLSLVRFM